MKKMRLELSSWDEKKNVLKNWIYENRFSIFIIFVIYQISILSIGILNYPYIDDIGRMISGIAGFASAYSRWGSEYISRVVQGSSHLTDMGLTTHFLTGVILTIASIILVYTLTKKLTMMTAIASTMLGLNPWFLQCLSFRFDSPYMALSILFSILPFLFFNKKPFTFFISSIISIFMVFNTYQSSSGIYILMILALTFNSLIVGEKLKKNLLRIVLGMVSYLIALIMYMFETMFNPNLADRYGNTEIAEPQDIIATFIKNCLLYFYKIIERSPKSWIILVALVIIIFFISNVLSNKITKIRILAFTSIFLVLSSIGSFGVYLVFTADLAAGEPRYSYGFAIFITILVILTLNNTENRMLKKFANLIIALLCYYIITFSFVYSSSLYYQDESFKMQTATLAEDLKEVLNEDTNSVYINKLFNNSPIVENTAANYPILWNLVPSSESLYWPNQLLFQTYTGINKNLDYFDIASQTFSADELVVSNIYRQIYAKDNNIYIVNK
ncbi:glucosyltransferase domain-containing protein [Enterococcus sp. LJL120]